MGLHASIGKMGLHASIGKMGLHASIGKMGLHASIGKTGLHASIGKMGLHASIGKMGLHASIGKMGLHASIGKMGLHASISKMGLHASIGKMGLHASIGKMGLHASIGKMGLHDNKLPFYSVLSHIMLHIQYSKIASSQVFRGLPLPYVLPLQSPYTSLSNCLCPFFQHAETTSNYQLVKRLSILHTTKIPFHHHIISSQLLFFHCPGITTIENNIVVCDVQLLYYHAEQHS